jgi:glycolate oxidase FAD binding subunit
MLRPETEDDLAEILRGATGPLRIQGGGTRPLPEGAQGTPLTTAGLTGVVTYEPGALTLVVRAGTPLAEVQATLAAERQRLAFEPPDLRALLGLAGDSTIGGVAATNASGPRRVQAGACRDAMLGIAHVDGTGMRLRNGGRVMKNVTGYDLVKLMAGSRGALGVMTEIAFKVQALPEAEATLVAEGKGEAAGLSLLRQALATPYDISGAAHLSAEATGGIARTLLRVEGMAGSVAYRTAQLRHLPADWRLVEGEASAALWAGVRDVTPLAARAGAVWRCHVTPTAGAWVVDRLRALVAGPVTAMWDWGGGLLWLACPEGSDAEVRAAVADAGHATRVRGRGTAPALPPEPPEIAALTAGLRARFDPRGILNGGT